MLNHAKDHITTGHGTRLAHFMTLRERMTPSPAFFGDEEIKLHGHTGARTQDRGVISTALYRLSYTTADVLPVQ